MRVRAPLGGGVGNSNVHKQIKQRLLRQKGQYVERIRPLC